VAEWSAEVVVGRDEARALIADQFFEPRSLRLLAEGWDNTVWLADERWVFRFPRRRLAIPGVEREMATLRLLARQLPLPVPEPAFLGRATDAFPWPFFGAALVPGRELADADLDDAARARLARPLGEFLRALHAVDVPDLPADPFGRADMRRRTVQTAARLEEIGMPAPAALLEQAAALPPAEPSVVAHGDLHVRHLLVDDGEASGVIDWGDLCRGDPGSTCPSTGARSRPRRAPSSSTPTAR
jgi:aminoglycoside phosphotransferase (APT) family kinase protein